MRRERHPSRQDGRRLTRCSKVYKTHARLELHVPTPPLEALTVVLSEMGTGTRRGKVVALVDVRQAYFYAPSRRRVFVELPPEDFQAGDEHMFSDKYLDVVFCAKTQLPRRKVSFNDHRFLTVFDSHQELCVSGAGLCIVFSTELCLFVSNVVCYLCCNMSCVLAQKHDFLNISGNHEISKNTTAVVFKIWAARKCSASRSQVCGNARMLCDGKPVSV